MMAAPQLPPFDCPDGLSEMAYLRRRCAWTMPPCSGALPY